MNARIRFFLATLILGSLVGCDQASKTVARQALQGRPPQSVLGGAVRFELAHNPGGFLSLGANIPDGTRQFMFVATNLVLLGSLAGFVAWNRRLAMPLFVGLLCVLAGGIGNLIDRVWNNGLVTDFVHVGAGPIRTGIFNLADIAVVFGLSIVCFYLSRTDRTPTISQF